MENIKIETEKILNQVVQQIKNVSTNVQYKDATRHLSLLEGELDKLKELEFIVAMVGTMKAGKSTTINAIVGQEILPHRVEAMTTLPTRVTHKLGQKKPCLLLTKKDTFNELIKEIKTKISDGYDIESSSFDYGKQTIEIIKNGQFLFKDRYEGKEEIFSTLKLINDLMRIAKEASIKPPYGEFQAINDFPSIEVEFYYLKDKEALKDAKFSLLDTPGPNEYGQSEYLKEISKKLTEQASAVMLIVDFTQISGESTEETKRQVLDALQYIGENKVSILLNKFDEDRKQSNEKGYDKAKKDFADKFIVGKISSDNVFPVSSREAFYANLGLSELAINNRLSENLVWLKEFGQIIIGRNWKRDIDDNNEVRECCNKAYSDSYFEEPMKNIINLSYDRAQLGSIESALQTLEGVTQDIKNIFHTSMDSLTITIDELKKQIVIIRNETSKIEAISKKIDDTSQEELGQIESLIDDVMEKKLKEFLSHLETKFSNEEEKLKEQSTQNQTKVIEKRHEEKWVLFGFRLRQKALKQKKEEVSKKINEYFKTLAREGKVQFEDQQDKNDFIEIIGELSNDELNAFLYELEKLTLENIELTIKQLNKLIDEELKDIIDEIKSNLGENVLINIPNIKIENENNFEKVSLEDTVRVDKKIENIDQGGFWGSLKRKIDFFGNKWGIDEREKNIFVVSKEEIMGKIKSASSALKERIHEDIKIQYKADIETPINDSIDKLIGEIEKLRELKEDILRKRQKDELNIENELSSAKKELEFIEKIGTRIKIVNEVMGELNG